jgi:hypothetical protein
MSSIHDTLRNDPSISASRNTGFNRRNNDQRRARLRRSHRGQLIDPNVISSPMRAVYLHHSLGAMLHFAHMNQL